jgi:methyltransferase (TIGR00027 family)
MYEYMIARTAYFDHIVEQALQENIPQIVFLGAGYDSRPYRFRDLIKDTRIFELDIHTTQQRKTQLLHQANISMPKQLILVPVNFNTDNLKDVLLSAGYDQTRKTLFIWEGVTHYLLPKAVDDTLSFIRSNSPPGSTVCFDYTSVSPDMFDQYGVKELRENRRASASGEPSRFGIAKGKIESFLSERGYEIIDHLTAQDMERNYLTLHDGSSAGRVLAIFCFVHASVVG